MKKNKLMFIFMISILSLVSCKTLYRNFDFPKTEGRFAVGSKAIELTNEDQLDIYAKTLGEKRRFMIQLWYPVDKSAIEGKSPVLYGTEIEEVLKSLNSKLAKGFNYLHEIPTNTYADVPLSEARTSYPLILFSPGNHSTRFQSMVQISHLVSKGYIVIGVDHPYTSGAVIFPDGQIIRSEDRFKGAFKEGDYSVPEELEIRVKDVQTALNYVLNYKDNPELNLNQRIDTTKIAAFGHSLGGATVLQLASEDDRIRAVFSEEGGVWGSVCETGISVPLMYLQASQTLEAAEKAKADSEGEITSPSFIKEFKSNLNQVISHSSSDFYYLNVKGFMHFSFSDAPLFSDYLSGDVEYRHSLNLVNAYLSAFFDYYLLGKNSDLLINQSVLYPEVEFKKNTADIF